MDSCQMLVMDEVSAETVLYRKIILLAEIKIICSNYCEKLLITDNNSKETTGVSIKFQVGSWLEKSNRRYEQGAVRPLNLGGSGGMLPQKI